MTLSFPGFMFQAKASRRQMLAASLSMPAAAIAANAHAGIAFEDLVAADKTPPEHIRYGHLSFADKTEKMRAKIRLEFGSDDDTYLWWYTFVLFAVTIACSVDTF